MPDPIELRTRILIVEDEPLIAYGIELALEEAGFVIAGIAGNVLKALSIIENDGCDAAVIDANLAGVSAAPVASALTTRGLPFVVTSGYSVDQQHEVLRGAPHIRKPFQDSQLIDALKRVVSDRLLRTQLSHSGG